MSRHSRRLARDLQAMAEQIELCQEVLAQLKSKAQEVARRVDRNEEPLVVILESVRWADRRSEFASASEQFEAVRHRVRLAMCAVAVDQEGSMADLARALGVSRQLTHRLYREVREVLPSE